MKVDTRGMVPLGTEKHKNNITFKITYDWENQLQSLHGSKWKKAELTPEELDSQVLQIYEQKKKEALKQSSNLPDVQVLESSKRNKNNKLKKLGIGSKFNTTMAKYIQS